MKKIIIEIDDDFCPKCFTQINMYLNSIGFKMTHMKTVDAVQVYKWVDNE